MNINFARNAWNTDDITYAYSYRFEDVPEFTQFEDHVENRADPNGSGGYEYISVMSRKQYGSGTRITTHCSFEDDGAPLIVLADKMYTDPRGVVRYGEYMEVVLYKNGVNVWRMWYREGKVTWKKLLGVQFPVTTGDIHTLSVTAWEDNLRVEADEHTMTLLVPDMYTSFHAGIDACEGINRFYDMTVDGPVMEQV